LRRVVLALLLSLGAPAASAELSFTAQDRSVSASSESIVDLWEVGTTPVFPDFDPPSLTQTAPTTDDDAAPGFDPYDATASSADSPVAIIAPPSGTASATQTSSLDPASISATGSFETGGDAYTLDALTLSYISSFLGTDYDFGIARDQESGESSFSVDFEVTDGAVYHLDASVSLSPVGGFLPGDTTGNVAVLLLDSESSFVAGVSINQSECYPDPCTSAVEEDITLAPGSYEIVAVATGSATGQCLDVGGGITCFSPAATASFEVGLEEVAAVPASGAVGRLLIGVGVLLGARSWRSAQAGSGIS
jgi:hypothetical protein